MKKTKIIITAAIMAALVTATACGGKDQASTPTEAQTTTTAVKQVNSINTENTIDKQEATEASVENTACIWRMESHRTSYYTGCCTV